MPLGFHYSQAQDWWHPGGASYGQPWDPSQAGDFDAYLDRIAVPQVRELCGRYGPVACLFFDTPAKMTPARAARIEAVLPARTAVNDRPDRRASGRDLAFAPRRFRDGGPRARLARAGMAASPQRRDGVRRVAARLARAGMAARRSRAGPGARKQGVARA